MAQIAKIMLVEDDNNLGEIYQARMAAEGYTVVVAHDGEEALALAAKEKPDLIISDVMMPKISGFEMLDILRNTPGLKDTKVIMLTALGQAEDKTRADSLGADRYLVKSQVTLEDIVDNARALLGGGGATPAQPQAEPQPAAAAPATTPQADPMPVAQPPAASQDTPAPQPNPTPQSPVVSPMPVASPAPAPQSATPAQPQSPPTTPPAPDPVQTAAPQPLQPQPVVQPAITPTPAATSLAEPLQADAQQPQASTPDTAAAPAPTQNPEPASPAPAAAASNPADASNDKVLTGAVDELLANAPQQEQPAAAGGPTEATAPSEQAPAPQPQKQPAAENSDDESEGDDKAPGDNTPVPHKKVISPINNVEKKPDLNSLLAAEEAKNQGASASQGTITTNNGGVQTTVVMPSSGEANPNVGSSTPNAAPDKNGGGVDPNSIAL
jgi:two-component system, OmpR family, response regulator RpaB